MTRAKAVSIENHDQWFVMQDTEGFSAVPLYKWTGSGRKLIAIFEDGWQLPDK